MQISAYAKSAPSLTTWNPTGAVCCSVEESEPVDVFMPTQRSEADRQKLGESLWGRYLEGQQRLQRDARTGRAGKRAVTAW